MIPPWLTIGLWILGFVSLVVIFMQALCAAAKNGDRQLDDEQRETGRLIEVGHFGDARRRGHVRNGIGGKDIA